MKLTPRQVAPATWAAVAQTLVALVVIFAARTPVREIPSSWTLGPVLGIKPQLLALLLSPIATEPAGDVERHHLGAAGQASPGRWRTSPARHDDPGDRADGVRTVLHALDPETALLLVGAGVTALAVAAMFIAFRHGFISRVFLTAMAGFYVLFAAIIVAFRLG